MRTPDAPLFANIIAALAKVLSRNIYLQQLKPVSGGGINNTYCLQTSAGPFMLKLNSRAAYPDMFRKETAGLQLIAGTQTIAVPQVVLTGDIQDQSFLLLEWIKTTQADDTAQAALGRQLAAMHQHTTGQFGLAEDNYMGSLPQSNRKHDDWGSFFVDERLRPMVARAKQLQLLSTADLNGFEKLYRRLPSLFGEEKPALLHGDLWSGNYLIGPQGKPYLIDPAVAYGHREFDIAMTTLFGGFDAAFYNAYHESFPLAPAWRQRLPLWNLYPLLLHLNLFGMGYLGQVRSALKMYAA